MIYMSISFQRKKEDFVCEKCGFFTKGNGYTNHCPKCLWSKHVDVYPGDRKALCKGSMEPIRVEYKENDSLVVHKCISCGFERVNRINEDDDFEAFLNIINKK